MHRERVAVAFEHEARTDAEADTVIRADDLLPFDAVAKRRRLSEVTEREEVSIDVDMNVRLRASVVGKRTEKFAQGQLIEAQRGLGREWRSGLDAGRQNFDAPCRAQPEASVRRFDVDVERRDRKSDLPITKGLDRGRSPSRELAMWALELDSIALE